MAVYQNDYIRQTMQETEKQEMRAEFYSRRKDIFGMFGMQRDVNLFLLNGEINVLEGIGVFDEKTADNYRKEIREIVGGTLGIQIVEEE